MCAGDARTHGSNSKDLSHPNPNRSDNSNSNGECAAHMGKSDTSPLPGWCFEGQRFLAANLNKPQRIRASGSYLVTRGSQVGTAYFAAGGGA
jgi:hypothetical protein